MVSFYGRGITTMKCPICQNPANCMYLGKQLCKKHWEELSGIKWEDKK